MSLEQKAAQLFIITPEALTGFQTVTQAGDATYKALQEYPVAGLIYFPQNLQNPKQLKTMTARTQELAAGLNQLLCSSPLTRKAVRWPALQITKALICPR